MRSEITFRRLILLLVFILLLSKPYQIPPASAQEIDPIDQWLAALARHDETVAYDPPEPGFDPYKATDKLIEALENSRDPFVRRYVAAALGNPAFVPELAVRPLTEALRDEDQSVREQATIALAKIGEPSIPDLVNVMIQPELDLDDLYRDKIYLPKFQAALALSGLGNRLWGHYWTLLGIFLFRKMAP